MSADILLDVYNLAFKLLANIVQRFTIWKSLLEYMDIVKFKT